MRLIDADALFRRVKTECNPYGKPTIGFEDGKKVMNWIEQAPTVSGWVSVKDRLPEPDENVIIWTKTGCMKYAQYHEDGSINPWYVYEDNARAWTNVISHWMPLPEPPEEDDA